jgi:hypothetical protein
MRSVPIDPLVADDARHRDDIDRFPRVEHATGTPRAQHTPARQVGDVQRAFVP